MRYAIIAAGEGSRLAAEGLTVAKPLVAVNGERLLDRLIRIFMDNDAEEIVVICNEQATEVASHLDTLQREGMDGRPVPLHFVVKSTPSSMHSFHEMAPWLKGGPFVMTTVDTVFREDEFRDFVTAFSKGNGHVFPVTAFVDDEKPLWVSTDANRHITGFHDQREDCRYVSAGIYGLQPSALDTLKRCMERGEHRMRNFQRALISEGCQVTACLFSKVIDIDHMGDIAKAEAMLQDGDGHKNSNRRLLTIQRDERFSPNAVEKDLAILAATERAMHEAHWEVNRVSERTYCEEVAGRYVQPNLILTMGRSEELLRWLEKAEAEGVTVINSVAGVRACNSRRKIHELMTTHDIPAPPPYTTGAAWVKSDGGHRVRFAANEQEVARLLQEDGEAVVESHVEGTPVKFYGVGDHFFLPDGYDELRQAAQRLAHAAGVTVFGGDAIVRHDGSFAIIDFNDWPSFSSCREEAARAIIVKIFEIRDT